MKRRDDNHKVAKIIKGLEQRIADLEEQDRQESTPNLLRLLIDQVTADDTLNAPREHTLTTGEWNDSEETGWRTSTWGQYD